MPLPLWLVAWRKGLLTIAGVVGCLYAVGVLYYVTTIPDIGLHAAFDPQVKRFTGECLSLEHGPPAALDKGDKIVALDGQDVRTWPQLVHALMHLRQEQARTVSDLAQAEELGLNYVRVNEAEWVRVAFQRPASGGEGARLACWCKVARLPPEELVPSILWFFLKLGLFLVGAVVFWNRPTDASARQFFLLCIVTLGAYMGGYHWSRIASSPALILVFMVSGVLLPPVLLHFYGIFPRPKVFLQRQPRRALAAIYGLPLAFLVAMVVTYFRITGSDEDVKRALLWLLGEIYAYFGVAAVWYLASVLCLVHSYREARDTTERNQVKWILFGSLAALVPIGSALYLVAAERSAFVAGAATWPMFAASICFTAAFTISITRYRLMQLDQLVGSGMVYFAISFLAVAVYYAVVGVGVFVAGTRFGSPWSQALSVSATALVLTLLFDLVRSRLKKVLDRRFSREKHQLDRTLRRMGQAIEQLVDPPTLARQVLRASAEVLGVSRGGVWLRDGSPPLYRLVDALGPAPPLGELSPGCPLVEAVVARGAVAARGGRDGTADPVQRQLHFLGGAVAHALTREGQLLALLVLGPKDRGAYTPEDFNLLAALTQLAALALKSAERHRTIEALNRDLQAKVEKISEQQRRILALQTQLRRQAGPPEPAAGLAPAAPEGIIGSSPVVQQLLHLVRKVSASQSVVLIRGESGTGKELLARALHAYSPRADRLFVKVLCAALSPGLLESELFGHVKGAFTGAHRDKIGRFELAHGGTLFLDEIGDISLEVQTKLLRVLQEKTFERVGSSEPLEVDVRVIAATHQDLERLIAAGRFREDLYYRLNVISIAVPPLRERREDIPELVAHFLERHGQRCGKGRLQIDDDALALLKACPWPGNIRQLESAIERAVVVAEGPSLMVDDLPAELVAAAPAAAAGPGDARLLPGSLMIQAERQQRDSRERERLVRALAAAKGNKAEAARALGLARSTLLSRLKKYGLS